VIAQRLVFTSLPIALAVTAGMVTIGSAPVAVRLPIVLAFLLFGPGAAIVGLLRLTDPLHQLTLAIAISIGITGLLSLLFLYSGFWSPTGILITTIAITIVAALAQDGWHLIQRRRLARKQAAAYQIPRFGSRRARMRARSRS
jgi:phosphate starvation-inducible membrane PsiE